jgi:hypothetical protein
MMNAPAPLFNSGSAESARQYSPAGGRAAAEALGPKVDATSPR